MYPHERSLVRHLAGKPFAIIGVNSNQSRDNIREIAIEKKITWRSFWNGPNGTDGPISTRWCVESWPTSYLIDSEGVIRYKNLRGKPLDQAIEKLMAELDEDVKLVGIDHESEGKVTIAVDSRNGSNGEEENSSR